MGAARWTEVGRFMSAAEKYAAREVAIATLTAKANNLPDCERNDEGASCLDEIRRTDPDPDLFPDRLEGEKRDDTFPVEWWRATAEEIDKAEVCAHCRARMEIWRERWPLKKGLGGLKRTLLDAYRRMERAGGGTIRGDGKRAD